MAAAVHQYNQTAPDITVEKLVSYERGYVLCVEWAMEVTDTIKLRKREVARLSGGQKQWVCIAMALAQKTKLLFLDEPTTYLDIWYQIELLEIIRRLNQEYKITIIMVLHDMNHAVYYSDNIIGLKGGKILVQGEPEKVITSDCIEEIYGIRLQIASLQGKRIVMTVR